MPVFVTSVRELKRGCTYHRAVHSGAIFRYIGDPSYLQVRARWQGPSVSRH